MVKFLRGMLRGAEDSLIHFEITDAAAGELRKTLASQPRGSRVCLKLFIDDPRFEVEVHYDMQIRTGLSRDVYAFGSANGIPIAIHKKDLHALNGFVLDYYRGKNVGGFLFKNPNQADDSED